MSSLIDLHCHSTASDGRLRPAAVVQAASAAGVRVLALTDHDGVSGLPEAQSAAAEAGLHLVPGIELSTTWNRQGVHIVGLGIDPGSSALNHCISEVQARRRDRAETMAHKLEGFGLSNALQRAQTLAEGGLITRTHFARLLVESGISRDLGRAFKNLLGNGKPADVKIEWITLASAIEVIHAAGGCAVLAHPMKYKLSNTKLRQLFADFATLGGDAVEVCCGNTPSDETQFAAAQTRRFNLAGSVGSDFHDPGQTWIGLGRLPPLPVDITPVWERLPTQRAVIEAALA